VKDLYSENCKTLKKKLETRHWKMERPPMLLEWQNKYCENGYVIDSNLQIQYIAHQNSNVILYRNIKISPEINIEEDKTPPNAGSITIPNFKLYYRAIETKTAWHRNKTTQLQLSDL
jgi:hypothetical protein